MYVSSPGNGTHWYAELTISSPAVAKTVASTHNTYPQRDGQAEWAWMNTRMVDPPKVTNFSATAAVVMPTQTMSTEHLIVL